MKSIRSVLAPSTFLALGLLASACDATLGLDQPEAPRRPPVHEAPPNVPPSGPVAPAPGLSRPAAAGGMFLPNDVPTDMVAKKYGFTPTKEWLDHLRLSSVRLAFGCSGSVVSPNGLVMTNHHCAETCIEQLSTKKKDLMKAGFWAKTEADEAKCPEIEANQLVEITDVTPAISEATAGKSGAEYNDAQKAAMSRLEKACATSDAVRCDVISLWHGGRFHLYKYKRFQDVRLVFAPEVDIAFFGGDPDNFMFPRYDLDASFLRIYDGGKPAKMDHHLSWSKAGLKAGDLVVTSGHPARTSRELTVAQLEYQRDVSLPAILMRFSYDRGVLTQFSARGAEQARIAKGTLFYIENGLKALKGQQRALAEPSLMRAKQAEERALRAFVEADPERSKRYGGAWTTIARAQDEARSLRGEYSMIEQAAGFESDLFRHARDLVRVADEKAKPNEKRLREYVESRQPALKQKVSSTAPVYEELEILKLTTSLGRLREELGADHPFVKRVLGKDAPADVAARIVKETKLSDPKARLALLDGGKAAVDASKDPMIALARLVDPDARAIRKSWEDRVEAPVKESSELIAKARFLAWGTSTPPDATFTLRFSFGTVRGWNEAGRPVDPFTTFGGVFDRATGRPPYALPKSWLDSKAKLVLSTPMNFASDNDIVGGNSGSPVVNAKGEVVGLIFDGNIHSLGGDYHFDDATNRAISVDTRAITHALDKIYGATRLSTELGGK